MADKDIFYDDDADLSLLEGKTVAVIGYGSQGHAHSLNLKDSGVDVVVGLREASESAGKAGAEGLEVVPVAEAAARGDLVMVLVPDELHRRVWEGEVAEGIEQGNLVLFGHGFSVHYDEVAPPPDVDVALVAPKGPGHIVRRQYLEGSGVPGLVAIDQDATGTRSTSRSPTRGGSAARAAASSGPPSARRPKPISSASRPSCAAVRRSSCAPASRRWSRRATTRAWRTSSACTSSS